MFGPPTVMPSDLADLVGRVGGEGPGPFGQDRRLGEAHPLLDVADAVFPRLGDRPRVGLLLDEPSNYLDITSIRWLERFLAAWPGELLLITHDRSFMDNVVTHVLGIHRRRIRKVEGDTGKYYEQISSSAAICS